MQRRTTAKAPPEANARAAEQVTAGEAARQLLDDPVIQRAFEALEREYFDAWRASEADEREGRERLYYQHAAVAHLRRHLRIMVENGTLSKKHLEQVKQGG